MRQCILASVDEPTFGVGEHLHNVTGSLNLTLRFADRCDD